MRLWHHMIQNLIGDGVLLMAGGCAVTGIVLLLSQILIDLTGNH